MKKQFQNGCLVTLMLTAPLILLLVGALSVILLTLYFQPPCSERELSTHPSPKGRYTATVFERNCGATTGYMTHINLRKSVDRFRRDWSGVIDQGTVILVQGSGDISLKWKGDHHLLINCAFVSEDKLKTHWNDVYIACDDPKP